MASVISAIKNTVPISLFNRGLAGKIFSEVKKHGPKVVMKNNIPEAVIIPPDEYVETQDELNDYYLMTLALERMNHYDVKNLVSEEDALKTLGITQEELDSVSEED